MGTRERGQAHRLIHARNEAQLQLGANLQISRAYLMASDPDSQTRSWQYVMHEIARTKTGTTRGRWLRAIRDKTFDPIRNLPILETRSQHFLEVLAAGTVATNAYLRRVHNFALDMNWLSCPLIVRKQWPRVQFKKKRAASVSNRRRRYAPASFRYSLRCAYAPVCPLADRRPKPTSS